MLRFQMCLNVFSVNQSGSSRLKHRASDHHRQETELLHVGIWFWLESVAAAELTTIVHQEVKLKTLSNALLCVSWLSSVSWLTVPWRLPSVQSAVRGRGWGFSCYHHIWQLLQQLTWPNNNYLIHVVLLLKVLHRRHGSQCRAGPRTLMIWSWSRCDDVMMWWCDDALLQLNIMKTKDTVSDFREKSSDPPC